MKIVKKKLSELTKPAKNIRVHTEKQIAEYVRSLKMFGQIKPIVIDEHNEIIAGNGLYEALKAMGEIECDCYVVAGLTNKQKKKLMLADNKVYELGITDSDMFQSILAELDGDLDIPGWDEDLLSTLTASLSDADDIIESYGTFSDDDVETINSVEREVPKTAVEAPANYAPVEAPTETQPIERFVICPKCGEKICL